MYAIDSFDALIFGFCFILFCLFIYLVYYQLNNKKSPEQKLIDYYLFLKDELNDNPIDILFSKRKNEIFDYYLKNKESIDNSFLLYIISKIQHKEEWIIRQNKRNKNLSIIEKKQWNSDEIKAKVKEEISQLKLLLKK